MFFHSDDSKNQIFATYKDCFKPFQGCFSILTLEDLLCKNHTY